MKRQQTKYPWSSPEGHIEALERELWEECREREMLKLACLSLYDQLYECNGKLLDLDRK